MAPQVGVDPEEIADYVVGVEDAEIENADIADNGVDLTLIRQLLAMTPGERLEMIVASSRNLAEMFEHARVR